MRLFIAFGRLSFCPKTEFKKYNLKKVQKWQNKYDNIIVKIERGKQ